MTQAELARRTARPVKTVNEIVQGKAAITPETALQFERVLSVPASEWLQREANYREARARAEARARLAQHKDWLRQFPLRELEKLGLIARGHDNVETVESLLQFLGVASPEVWEDQWARPQVSFRRSKSAELKAAAISSWLRIGEMAARELHCEPFDAGMFRDQLAEIRHLVREPVERFHQPLVDLSASAGVAVVFVPEIGGIQVFGATRWLTPDKAVIQLSGRYKSDDQFWFTFFHDAGHILLHGKRAAFVDLTNAEGADDEAEADAFARDFLVPENELHRHMGVGMPTTLEIVDIAAAIGISPGVLVGRLQRDGRLPWSRMNELKRRIELVRA